MTGMLVSVRNLAEARIAAARGVDFLDLKDPAAGALGGLPAAEIALIVRTMRATDPQLKISATIGDWPASELEAIDAAIAAVAASGVDFVKVGVPGQGGSAAHTLLQRLAASPHAIVPVLIADEGIDEDLFAAACALPFPALMVDTEAKLGGSLLDRVSDDVLNRLIALARSVDKPLGLAGALRVEEVPRLRRLQADFAGFRSAVCEGARSSRLDAAKLGALRAELCRAPLPAADEAATRSATATPSAAEAHSRSARNFVVP